MTDNNNQTISNTAEEENLLNICTFFFGNYIIGAACFSHTNTIANNSILPFLAEVKLAHWTETIQNFAASCTLAMLQSLFLILFSSPLGLDSMAYSNDCSTCDGIPMDHHITLYWSDKDVFIYILPSMVLKVVVVECEPIETLVMHQDMKSKYWEIATF